MARCRLETKQVVEAGGAHHSAEGQLQLPGDVAQQRFAQMAVKLLAAVQHFDQAVCLMAVALQHRIELPEAPLQLRHGEPRPAIGKLGSVLGPGSCIGAELRFDRGHFQADIEHGVGVETDRIDPFAHQ